MHRVVGGRWGAVRVGMGLSAAVTLQRVWCEEEKLSPPPPQKPGIYKSAGFDPTALEEVAEAVRATESRGRQHLEALKTEATNAQEAEKKKAAEYKQAGRRLAQEAREAKRREDAATRDARRQHEEARSQYRSILARERSQAATRLDQALKEGEQAREAEHEQRLDALRRETAEYEATLRREVDAAYLKASATWTARAERESHDLKLAELRQRGAATRDAAVEAVTASLSTVGGGVKALLADEKRCAALVGVFSAATLGVVAARHATRVAGEYVKSRLAKPALVRETSRGYGLAATSLVPNALANSVSRVEGWLTAPMVTTPSTLINRDVPVAGESDPTPLRRADPFAAKLLEGAAYEPALEARLLRVAASAANTRHHRAPFRHALLHGPPGTGKTMFAKRLAACAGMDFAIASGGDVAPLGRDAVTEIHKLFDWAHASPRGLLLLVDEADAFARSRALKPPLSEDARNALNAFLYRTGSPNADVLVIFATNAPELFDKAVLDRVDDVITFPYPGLDERRRILKNGLAAFARLDAHARALLFEPGDVRRAATADPDADPDPPTLYERLVKGRRPVKRVALADVTDDDIEIAAKRTEGLSGREITKLAVAWRAAAYAADPVHSKLDAALLRRVTTQQIHQTKIKRAWYDGPTPLPELPPDTDDTAETPLQEEGLRPALA